MNLSHSRPIQNYKAIPLNNGYAFQRFRVQLGNHLLIFRLHWLTRYGYFALIFLMAIFLLLWVEHSIRALIYCLG